MNFAQPVLLYPNTTYVASYFAPKGHYSQDDGYFYTCRRWIATGTSILNSPPLHALLDSNGVINGVFAHSSSSTFPTSTVNAENYWVDVVFSPRPSPRRLARSPTSTPPPATPPPVSAGPPRHPAAR